MTEELGASMLNIRHKIVFVGNPSAGKTSLMNKIVNNEFKEEYDQTIGVDFFTKTVLYKDTIFKLQLWDSAGQEKYKSLIPSYVRGASLIFVIYDVSSEESFEAVNQWIAFIKENIKTSEAKLILIGNKIDLEKKIKSPKGEALAKKEGMAFFETSAKTGENVTNAFYSAISELDFFNDIRPVDKNIVKDLIKENNEEKNNIFDTNNNDNTMANANVTNAGDKGGSSNNELNVPGSKDKNTEIKKGCGC